MTGQASKVSKGLRSIGANIVKLASDAGELEYSVGGVTKSFSLFNEQGEALSTFDVLSKVAEDWDNMSQAEQSSLALSQAGKTQIDVYSSVLSNFSTAIKASETALGSQGSAMAENEKYMESLQGKTAMFRAEFENLVLGEGGLQDFAKKLVDAGTTILKFANTDIGQATIKLALLVGTFEALNAIIGSTALVKSIGTAVKLFGIMATSEVGLAGATEALTATLLSNPLFMGIVAVGSIILIAKAIDSVVESSDELNKSIEDLTSKTADLEAERSGLSTRDDLTQAEQNRLNLLNAQIEANKVLIQQQAEKAYTMYQAEQTTATKSQGAYEARTGVAQPTAINIDTEKASVQNMIEAYNELETTKSKSLEEDDKIIAKKAELISSLSKEAEELEAYKEKGVEISESDQKILDGIYGIVDGLQEQDDALSTVTGTTDEYDDSTESTTTHIEDLAKALGLSEEELQANADAMGLSIDQYSEYASAMQDFNDSIDSIQSAYSTLSDAVSEYNETGSYSLDTVQSLLALDGDYLSMLQVVNGQMVLNEDAIRNKVIAQAEEAKQTIYNTAIEKLNALAHSEAGSSATDAGNDASSSAEDWKTLSSATKEATMNALAYQIASSDKSKSSDVDAIIKETNQQISLLDSAVAGMGSNFAGSMGKASSATSKTNSEANKLKSTVEDLLKERIQEDIDKLKDAQKDEIKIIKDLIKEKKKEEKTSIKSIESQISAVEKLKDAEEKRVEDKISALEDEKDAVESYYDAEIAKLQQASTELDRNNKLMELQQNLALAQASKVMVMGESGKFEYQADEGAVTSAEEELYEYQQELALEQQIESLQAMKDTAIASLDAQISKWEEYKTRMSENYQSQIDSLNTYKQTVQDGYDEQIEALEESVETTNELYEEQIKTLENYKDNVEEFVDTLSEEQQRQLENQLNTIKQTASNYETDLENLKEYINKYNAMLAQKGNAGATVSTSTSIGASKRATGDASIDESGTYLIGDAPNTELVVGSKANGTLMNLSKGTGVVNAESTKTFAGLVNMFGKYGSISGSTGETINNSSSNVSSSNDVNIYGAVTIKANNPEEFNSWASGMLQTAYGH